MTDSNKIVSSRELMRMAMLRRPVSRIPVMPQICYDLAIQIEAAQTSSDWRDGYLRCAQNPAMTYDYVIDLAKRTGCDGIRLFVLPDPAKVVREGDDLIVIDPESNSRIGRLDLYGGGEFVPDTVADPVKSLDDAKKLVDKILGNLVDPKLAMLSDYRAKVPDLFVASAPGGITMNTYCVLRGREQAMMDFYERPDFVRAVMDMQVEAIIKRAEQLIPTGIDCFYIGDPSASASLISPKHFEEFCLPAYQKFCHHFRDRILIYIHICGNSSPILEMMAETGTHVVEPLDPLGGVEVADAKARIGSRVALMGGVNTLTLCDGSADDVQKESIRKCLEGGPTGYILAAGDMVPANTPLDNLQAMINVARKSLWKADQAVKSR
jgi:uroporphyrinogen-III decarboxylase